MGRKIMIIDCVSDLHGFTPSLPGGDLLILAGDYTAGDTIPQWVKFLRWLKEQPYRKKVVVGGNHDGFLMISYPTCKEEADSLAEVREFLDDEDLEGSEDFNYLCDSGIEFEGLKIWGSPWTKTFEGMNPKCKAFTFDTESELLDKFELIPEDMDILITHSPPYGILDSIPRGSDGSLLQAGSRALYSRLKYGVRPRLHVFGHIHEGYGKREFFPTWDNKMMVSVNASYVNERYKPVNSHVRIEL